MIHETAIIDPAAKLGDNVTVGPYTIIGPNVSIDNDTVIGSHVVIKGLTTIGKGNQIFQFCSIGEDPQDLKYKGEQTELRIGNHNIFREFCTINRGTTTGGVITYIGDHNLLMAYVHVAHDCHVGNHIVFSNNASLAGHVQVDDYAILGGLSGIHQFCRIGAYSFAAGGSMIVKDVPPCVMVSGYYAKPFGLNTEGLRRRGFSPERINEVKKIYRIIYRRGLTTEESVAAIKAEFPNSPDAGLFLEILEASERGIVR